MIKKRYHLMWVKYHELVLYLIRKFRGNDHPAVLEHCWKHVVRLEKAGVGWRAYRQAQLNKDAKKRVAA